MAKKIVLRAQYQALIETLREVREEKGFDQMQVCKLLDTYKSYINKIELGERRIDLVELLELLPVYGMTLQQFITRLSRRDPRFKMN